MSYYDSTNQNVRLLHCTTPTCSAGTPNTVATTTGVSLQHDSLALDSNGFPVVSYLDGNAFVAVTHCNDLACAPGGDVTNELPDPNGGVTEPAYTSIVLDSNGFAGRQLPRHRRRRAAGGTMPRRQLRQLPGLDGRQRRRQYRRLFLHRPRQCTAIRSSPASTTSSAISSSPVASSRSATRAASARSTGSTQRSSSPPRRWAYEPAVWFIRPPVRVRARVGCGGSARL